MNNKIDFKQLAEQAWKEFEEARKECVENIAKTNNARDIYPQLNKLFGIYDKAMIFSENQYTPDKDERFRSFLDKQIGSFDAKGAKLYDVLVEFFGHDLGISGMFQIIQMIRAYANME